MAKTDMSDHKPESLSFSYRSDKYDKVFISWQGKQVMILKGTKARSFLNRITGQNLEDQQMVMAKITGNFKRGNERRS